MCFRALLLFDVWGIVSVLRRVSFSSSFVRFQACLIVEIVISGSIFASFATCRSVVFSFELLPPCCIVFLVVFVFC